jgi:hypothetical protein
MEKQMSIKTYWVTVSFMNSSTANATDEWVQSEFLHMHFPYLLSGLGEIQYMGFEYNAVQHLWISCNRLKETKFFVTSVNNMYLSVMTSFSASPLHPSCFSKTPFFSWGTGTFHNFCSMGKLQLLYIPQLSH